MSATEALSSRTGPKAEAELLLAREPEFGEHCELVLESCCLGQHRKRNCESGKQFAKSGSACMDVELSKDVTTATESFNDCCMSCSLGILAARTGRQQQSNETWPLVERCKLMTPLASSLSGQLYEQTYIECCQENLPRQSGALTEPGQAIDCARSNPCAQKCVQSSSSGARDRCDCFVGYKLAPDGLNCVDVDECKLNQHSCNRKSELCDNIAGGFRCLARSAGGEQSGAGHSKGLAADVSSSSDRIRATPSHNWHPNPSLNVNPNPNLNQNLNPNPNPNNPDDQSAWDQLSGAQQFISLRLCPLNSRWNSHELRCEPISSSSSSDHHQQHHLSRAISSSVIRSRA